MQAEQVNINDTIRADIPNSMSNWRVRMAILCIGLRVKLKYAMISTMPDHKREHYRLQIDTMQKQV